MRKEIPDLAGKEFGRWKVQDEYIIIKGQRKWKCVCKCGTKRYVFEGNLLSGKSKSCGCYPREYPQNSQSDLTGQVFGKLERKSKNAIDLTGSRFGRLTVLFDTKKRSYKGSIIWHCKCDCGNQIDVHSDRLIFGRCVSCGCRKKEWQKQIHSTLHYVDNTYIEFLEKRNHRSDNTSGYQGVQKINNNKYRSTIGFKGERFHLGYYDTFEAAVTARKEAEDRLHKAFVEQYYK